MSRIFIGAKETFQPAPSGPVLATRYIDQPLKWRYHEIYRHCDQQDRLTARSYDYKETMRVISILFQSLI